MITTACKQLILLPISIINFMMYRCSCQITIFFICQDITNIIDVILIVKNKRVDTA